MPSDYQLMLASLDKLADQNVDIAPLVSQQFMTTDSVDLQVYADGNALQLEYMVTKVVEMLLFFAQGNPRQTELSYYDVPFHDDLGVTWPMYEGYMQVMLSVLQNVLGDAWDENTARAWHKQTDAMLKVIRQHIQPLSA
ncbi:MAG: globin [Gammaproteobacteria bacterium]|jgi:hypothetical protein|nr:globin [Gammaproteobacteria bacterium]MCP4882134.1 globin [Gammaproteobacteria bacterium]MDP6165564.1 globin [Gammaproteobacteria bacterium]